MAQQMAQQTEINIGTFKFARETKETVKYERENENGRVIPQYVHKTALGGARPAEIQVVVRY